MAASACFFVCTILITVKVVFGNECSSIMNLGSCDECIRCGGHWCSDPKEYTHCAGETYDSWCSGNRENLLEIEERNEPADSDKPTYLERTVQVGNENIIDFWSIEPKITLINTTQNRNFVVKANFYPGKGSRKWYIEASPGIEFCQDSGKTLEEVYVEVVMSDHKTLIQYHVPCACPCTERAQVFSKKCSGRGTYACGVCSCPSEWTGKHCEKSKCEGIRGDLQCTNPAKNDVECSGNGYCGPCETCVCFTDRPGSKYFDKELYCADICMTTSDCDQCLQDPTPGRCQHSYCSLTKIQYNETLETQRDSLNRSIWVQCNATVDGCSVEYMAMKDENDEIVVMLKGCNPHADAIAGGVSVTVPVVLTVLAIAAVAAATAGYIVWKNRPPALPLADTQYQNIGAEDCVGSNPLYIPPTSYYNNPTYGKN